MAMGVLLSGMGKKDRVMGSLAGWVHGAVVAGATLAVSSVALVATKAGELAQQVSPAVVAATQAEAANAAGNLVLVELLDPQTGKTGSTMLLEADAAAKAAGLQVAKENGWVRISPATGLVQIDILDPQTGGVSQSLVLPADKIPAGFLWGESQGWVRFTPLAPAPEQGAVEPLAPGEGRGFVKRLQGE